MKRTYSTIFLVSCSILMFEVSLTRLFSIYLWYHFAYMVISLAMLGIGASGAALSFYSWKGEDGRAGPRARDNASLTPGAEFSAALLSLSAGIAIAACFIVSNHIPFDPAKFSWDGKQVLYLALYCLILSIPFFFSGFIIASAFLRYSARSASVYASDLLGAGSGALAVLMIMNFAGAEYAVMSASVLCLAGACISGSGKIKFVSLLALSFILVLFFARPDIILIKMSPYKRLSQYLKYPGSEHLNTYRSSYAQIDTFKSPAVRYAPGLSLDYLEPLPEQTGFAVDGDRVDVITGAGDALRLKFLEYLPASLVYATARKDTVLVLEPKGGLHALMAGYFGAGQVHKVESNPMIVRIIQDEFNKLSGGIFTHDTWTGYGRNFLKSGRTTGNGPRLYDIIDLPMTGAAAGGAFGISEDYQYTVEAFTEYLSALTENGVMSVSLYLSPPPRTEFRLIASIIRAFERMGVSDPASHLAAVRSWDSMTILAKRSPFTGAEIDQIRDFSLSRRFDHVYYPGINPGESNRFIKLAEDVYSSGFRSLIDPETRASFIKDYIFDIRPVYDNNPFFHYYLKLEHISEIYRTMGGTWLYFLEEGYLLPVLFLIVLILCAVLIVTPAVIRAVRARSGGGTGSGSRPRTNRKLTAVALFYFAMLGAGFMLVEVSIIQKLILLFENPAYSVAVLLTAILVSSGTGSMMSSRHPVLRSPYSIVFLSVLIIAYSMLLPAMMDYVMIFDLYVKITVVPVLFFPLGFFMGIPFPTGIRALGLRDKGLIPWAWAVNACFSVLAPILTIMLAVAAGFRIVLLTGALVYFLAFLALRRMAA